MMKAIRNQLRRAYADHGQDDKDFTEQQARLRAANLKLAEATSALVRASVHLNDVCAAQGFDLDSFDKGALH